MKLFTKFSLFKILQILLFAATIILGLWGWFAVLPDLANAKGESLSALRLLLDSIFLTLKAFLFGDIYNQSANFNHDWRLSITRWTGMVVALNALLQAGIAICFRPLARLRAQFCSGHVVVIGEDERARLTAQNFATAGRKVTYHSGDLEAEHDGVLIIPRAEDVGSKFMCESLDGAERLIVAETDDTHTVSTALHLASLYPDKPIFAILDDPWLAKHARFAINKDDEQADLVVPVAWSDAIARTVLVKHPPYLLAQARQQEQIHAVIIGFDALGQSLVEDILNSSHVTFLDKRPRFTIIAPNAKALLQGFLSQHKGLIGDGENPPPIEFVTLDEDITKLSSAGEKKLVKICKTAPVTSFYVSERQTIQRLERALSVRDIVLRNGDFNAPIFLYSPQSMGTKPIPGGANLENVEIIVFGEFEDILKTSGILDETPDEMAKSHHAVYEGLNLERDASQVWSMLIEDYRRSNRRAIAHVPAKLASIGISLDDFLKGENLSPNALPKMTKEIKERLSNKDNQMALAKLEHERWMMDKWMDGWRYSEISDDIAKTRADLKSFEALDKETKDIDLKFVVWILKALKKS